MEEVKSFWQQKNNSWRGFVLLEEFKKNTEVISEDNYVWWNPFTWYIERKK